MVVGLPPECPMEAFVFRTDRHVVDTCKSFAHQTELVGFPVSAIVVPLIGKSNRNAIFSVRPKFLDQSVVQFAAPFCGEKGDDGLAAIDEFSAIAPRTVRRVGH